MKPFFSIIVPVYNKENNIKDTIQSLTSQVFSSIEFIIIDDKSTDNTLQLIKNYSHNDERIKIITHKKNKGVHQARTTGVNIASGKYILFLDGDDFFEANTFQKLYDYIINNTADVYEFSYFILPDKKIRNIQTYNTDRITALMSDKESCPFTLWNKVYKTAIVKKAFINTPYIPQNGPEDLYESFTIAYYAKSYFQIPEPLYNYCTGNGISTRRRTFEDNRIYFKNMKYVLDLTRNFLCAKKDAKHIKLVPDLEKRLVRDAIGWFIGSLTEKNDVNKSFLLLPQFFSESSLLPYFEQLRNESLAYKSGKFYIKGFIKKILGRK